MPSTLKSGGFLVAPRANNQGYDNGSLLEYFVSTSHGGNILPGDPVTLNTTGTIVQASVSTNRVVGVFAGMKPEGQTSFVPLNYFAAGSIPRAGFNGTPRLTALVIPPNRIFEAQFDGSVSIGDVGAAFDVTVGTGVTVATGTSPKLISSCRVHASSRSDAAGVVTFMGFSTRSDNAETDAYPLGLFKFNRTIDNTVSVA